MKMAGAAFLRSAQKTLREDANSREDEVYYGVYVMPK